MSEPELAVGDEFTVAQISLCARGLLQTWTGGPETGRLWSVPDPDELIAVQAVGKITRTQQQEGRFREVGLLSPRGVLILQPRLFGQAEAEQITVSGTVIQLGAPEHAVDSGFEDVRTVLGRAIEYCGHSDELLVVELGGWDAPFAPYCLQAFIAADGDTPPLSLIETSPLPSGSEHWPPPESPGQEGQTISAPASDDVVAVAPLMMLDAISTWGVEPWDLALTFAKR
jgi:hypothetical protein